MVGEQLILIFLIIQVESGGNPNAVGDNGAAIGILQIHKIMVDDCNRLGGNFTYNDRYDPTKSIQMFCIYTAHYSKGENWEIIARRWNGGPKGDTKKSTKWYWEKTQNEFRTWAIDN